VGRIGAHVAVGKGLVRQGLAEAADDGAEVLQVFLGSPRGWAPPRIDPVVAERFRRECAARGWPVFVHASYLINLASPDPEALGRSVASLRACLAGAGQIGASGVVVHAGSSMDGDREAALRRLVPAFDAVLDGVPAGVRLLVEPTAGSANAIASTLRSAAEYLHAAGRPEIGLCLDTCHLHAAGEVLGEAAALEASLEALTGAVGPGRIGLVHLNDSKDPRGSGRDRHESLGLGTIGEAGLATVMASPALAGVPFIIETATHTRDVAYAKDLRDRNAAAGAERP
jgi:deoxyribonuclease-4